METSELPPEDRAPVPAPRRVSRGLLAAVALATVVLAIATFVAFRSDGDDTTTERIGSGGTLPPFDQGSLEPTVDVEGDALPPLEYETFDGAAAELSTGGRPLVINFWAAYCVPCVAEMPAIEQAYQANRTQVDVLGLQVQEAAEPGLAMVERTGVTYPLGRDLRGDIVRELGGVNLPTTVFVTADGTIADVHVGAVTADELQALIDEHLLA
jgi:cytochrome c biogenesis protein CcmG, thiol:disulfide interchange protein DsbE